MIHQIDLVKTRGLMENRGLDCIIATSQENTFYSSGSNVRKASSLRLSPVILPMDDDPVFITHRNEYVTCQDSTWIKDLRVYEGGEWLPLKVWDFTMDVLKEKGLSEAKIGLEIWDVAGCAFDYVREKLPSVEFIDAGPIFDKLRSVKSTEELKLLSNINMTTAKVITVAFEMARLGDTERQIAQNMMELIVEYGADCAKKQPCLGAGKYTLELHHVPIDNKIKKGDLIHVDFGGYWKGYGSDISRMAVVGEPNERQLKAHSVILKVMWDTAEALQAGATVLDVHKAVKNSYESQGFKYPRVFIGHSTGIGGHETPMLGKSYGDWVLEPDMFFQFEPSLPMDNFRVHHEDSFVVQKSGPAKCVSEYKIITGPQIIR